ncbi:MAG: CAP domain-containing protein [Vulcanimicrobiaceae bacterium]
MSARFAGPLFLAALFASGITTGSAQQAPRTPHERPADAIVLYQHLNQVRSSGGVALLAFDQRLVAVARQHALDMIARHYFAHEAPDGRSPFDRLREAGIQYDYAGENLAMDDSADDANSALLHSPPHRENMLEPHYRRVGIAAVESPEGQEIFVEDFSD